jgi:hypothetical protein
MQGNPLSEAIRAVQKSDSASEAFNGWLSNAKRVLPFFHATALVTKRDPTGERDSATVQRIYSSVPTAYPVGGWKHLAGSDWAKAVLGRRQVLVSIGPQALERYFPDHLLLRSLGTITLINVPVVVCDCTVGAFAFMCSEAIERSAIGQEVEAMVAIAAPLFLNASTHVAT